MAEGLAYSVTSAAAGALLGVAVSVGMTRAMAYIFNRFEVGIAFHVTWRSLVVAYSLGVVLTFITVTISAWRVSKLSIVAAIREVTEPAPRATGLLSGLAGVAMLAGGAGITGWGLTSDTAWAFGTGVSLMLIGAAFVARALGRPERLVFTVTSLAVLVLWVLVAGDSLHAVTGRLEVGLETFFVGGVLMVAAATFALVYNAELLLGSLRGIGVLFARSVPAVRASIAYPLANKFRTGMTIAMMSLVVFALVMISTMNMNFQRLFLSTDSRGGWDIEVEALLTNAIAAGDGENRLGPLGEALDRKFYATKNIESVSQVSIANERSMQIAQLDKDGKALEAKPFRVVGADDTFLNENTIGLQARAQGFNSDRQVWDAVRKDPSNAVIDGSVVPGINYANVTETRFTLAGYKSGTKSFSMFPMQITSTAGNKLKTVRIIGIMNRGPSETYGGLWINRKSSDDAFPPLLSRYYIRLKPGLDAAAEAAKIEKALAQNGVSAHSIEKQVQKEQALSSAFFYLMQGFMGLGLGVGLAALAVIAFRTVVERRQQIGLMRAIGFSRMNVALTFVLESAFIALLGIANGIWLALVLANRLLSSDQFATAGFTTFYVPWLQIMLMAVLVFVASVLTTLIPSRQASGIPPAEALRYE
jgi:putative ABC transport system permease protein